MKKYFEKYLIGQMLKSKKFWYAISSVVVPALVTYLGVDEETAKNLLCYFDFNRRARNC